jgi:hypothetical protein
MILGMTPLTFVHVVLSLVGIVSGIPVVAGLLSGSRQSRWTGTFLYTTLATSLTGFLFPFNGFTPALGVGVIAIVIMAITLYALYVRRLAGPWRWIYAEGAVVSLYLNTFVLVVQAFLKVAPLHAVAPTGPEPPFAITQGIVLVAFILIGFLALRRFHPGVAAPVA